MKKRLAMMLMLVMTLCVGSAAAETLTIGTDGQVVDDVRTFEQVIIPVGITEVTFKGVTIKTGQRAHALLIHSQDVKLIFEGVNSFTSGGHLYGADGIHAAGDVTISGSGSVSATGGGGLYGGDGITASSIVIEDSVPTGGLTARGGDGDSSNGSEGSFSAEQIARIDKYPDNPQWFEYVEHEEPDDEENPPQNGDLPGNGDLPQTGSLPQTGDPSMLGAWALLLGASAAGLRLRRKK